MDYKKNVLNYLELRRKSSRNLRKHVCTDLLLQDQVVEDCLHI